MRGEAFLITKIVFYNMSEKLKEARFGVYHQGCFCGDFQEKWPDIELTEVSQPVTIKKTKIGRASCRERV